MEILFEDRNITVAVKPPQLLSEQTPNGDGFADLLAAHNQDRYIGTVHRLDRGVGGVMVYARTPAAAARLSQAVQARTLQKEYLAVLHGTPEAPQARLCDLLFHDRMRNKTFVVDRVRNGVKEAILDYALLGTREHPDYGVLSLVRVQLLTGRTHQIRVQFASRAHALLGDGKYGARDRCDIALFSCRLALPHPKTGKEMQFFKCPAGGIWELFADLLPNG